MERHIIPDQKELEAWSDVELAVDVICPSTAVFIWGPWSTRQALCEASCALGDRGLP